MVATKSGRGGRGRSGLFCKRGISGEVCEGVNTRMHKLLQPQGNGNVCTDNLSFMLCYFRKALQSNCLCYISVCVGFRDIPLRGDSLNTNI